MSNENGQLVELRLINSDKVTINLNGRYREVVKNGTVGVSADLANEMLKEGHLDGAGNLINRWWPADQPVPDFEKGGHNPVVALQEQKAKYEEKLADQAQALADRESENAELRAKLAALEAAQNAQAGANKPAPVAATAEAPVAPDTNAPTADAGAVVADAGARTRAGSAPKSS